MIDSSKYVVIDLETNGLSKEKYDLLEIAMYKPDEDLGYKKFLPLQKNKKINPAAQKINGITEEDLKGAQHLTQSDVDELIEKFELDKRIILQYSNFDERWIKHYFRLHRLVGVEKMTFYNFKRDIFSSGFQRGNCTKDNLCKLYNISGVQTVHEGLNDCKLEWKLYQAMDGNNLIVLNDDVYEFNEEYIVPVTVRVHFKNFQRKYPTPNIRIKERKVIKRFPIYDKIIRIQANVNGCLLEQIIYKLLRVKDIKNKGFLIENRKKLKKIGSLPPVEDLLVPFELDEEGMVRKAQTSNKKLEKEYVDYAKAIKENINNLLKFIKTEIFHDEEFFQQELVIKKEWNTLALCDLSNENTVLEIKTSFESSLEDYLLQYYITAKGREFYLLHIKWDGCLEFVIEKLAFELIEE